MYVYINVCGLYMSFYIRACCFFFNKCCDIIFAGAFLVYTKHVFSNASEN